MGLLDDIRELGILQALRERLPSPPENFPFAAVGKFLARPRLTVLAACCATLWLCSSAADEKWFSTWSEPNALLVKLRAIQADVRTFYFYCSGGGITRACVFRNFRISSPDLASLSLFAFYLLTRALVYKGQ